MDGLTKEQKKGILEAEIEKLNHTKDQLEKQVQKLALSHDEWVSKRDRAISELNAAQIDAGNLDKAIKEKHAKVDEAKAEALKLIQKEKAILEKLEEERQQHKSDYAKFREMQDEVAGQKEEMTKKLKSLLDREKALELKEQEFELLQSPKKVEPKKK